MTTTDIQNDILFNLSSTKWTYFVNFFSNLANEPDELCASMYSFHSSPEEKNKLLFALTQHGIETTVDRVAKKKRIRDWIQETVIQEDDEEEEENDEDDQEMSRRNRTPVVGHVSSVRAEEKAARTQIVTTVKDASNKHINPRTGKVESRPSEMGHHSGEASSHHHHDSSPFRERNDHSSHMNHSNQSNHTHEMHRENNGHDYQGRRTTKLVDVGSQTSSESQKQFEAANTSRRYTPERASSVGEAYATKNSHSVPTISHPPVPFTKTQNTQTNLSRMESSSRGFMPSYNSMATIAAPDPTHQTNPQHLQSASNITRTRDKSQPRQSYQQRHNTVALTKQPISRSVHNFSSLVNDSGYGSLDKLRPNDGVNIMASPTLSKRSIVQPKLATTTNGGAQSNDTIHINGLSHSQTESNSPFHSDSGGECSPRGSNGFVNYAGTNPPTNIPTDPNSMRMRNDYMKDTAYDRIRSGRRKR